MQTTRIAVFPPEALRMQARLFAGLKQLFGVSFVPGDSSDSRSCDGAIVFGTSRSDALDRAKASSRCLAFVDAPLKPVRSTDDGIRFADTPYLPASLRAIDLPDSSLDAVCGLTPEPGDDVIARKGEDVLWVHRKELAGTLDLVGIQPPVLSDSEYLFSKFQATNWFSLLPLLHFVREVAGWNVPAARACFMFDDPNLRWKTYGYVRYEDMVADAKQHNYHASFATIPLDAWYVHGPTARLFRENADRLSLLVHGNNHTRMELLDTSKSQRQNGLAAQALRRTDRLERISGVSVSRVMAAPHGACSPEMARALVQTGFEAACISRGSLMSRSPQYPWPISVGMSSAEFVGGLPIIPRLSMLACSATDVRLRMFLGQPVVAMGHHDDLREGLVAMRRVANLVNAGPVTAWTNMTEVARSNCWTRREKNVLHVKMYARRIQLQVPFGVTEIAIERPWLVEDLEPMSAVLDGRTVPVADDRSDARLLLDRPGRYLMLNSIDAQALNPHNVPAVPTHLRALIRRQLCEVRDRLRPEFDRWFAARMVSSR